MTTTSIPLATTRIIAEVRDGVGWLTFNSPERRNAVSLEMWQGMADATAAFEADASVRVVVMNGAGGKSFAAGADISEFEKHRANAEQKAAYSEISARGQRGLSGLSKPLIAMIQGFCIGGGLATAMMADIRISAEDGRFGIPAAKLGLAYAHHSLRRLVGLVGPAIAKEIMFTGRQLDAAEALRVGLVNRVVPAAELDAVVAEYVETMANNAPLSIIAAKRVVDELVKDADKRDMALCERVVADCFASQDYVEGRRAFMEKRKAAFTGR